MHIAQPPPPPPPPKGGVKVMKGQSLKEALEYIPAQPKKKFATLSSEERVKRLRQELADMEKLMRTGITPNTSGLAHGPSSAPAPAPSSGGVASDEYVPAQKKAKKAKKNRPPPPPPPPRPSVTAQEAPPPPPPPPKKVTPVVAVETPPPPPPPPKESRKRQDSVSKEPLKKRILSEQFSNPSDPFDSFGSAAPPPPPPPSSAHRSVCLFL